MNSITTIQAIKSTTEATRNWYADCLRFAKRWIKGKGKFSSEDLVQAFNKRHDFRPADGRVWGAVVRALKTDGSIRWVSFGKSRSETSNTYVKNIWKSKI